MLRLEGVEAGYGKTNCLKGISLVVNKGEIVALLGANGAGKTTTLMAISGLVPIRKGTAVFNGVSIGTISPSRIVQHGVSHVPEGRMILPRLSVLENLRLGAYLCCKPDEVRKGIEHVFGIFPILSQRRNQLGGTLSGGEQQMLAIGRGLMAKPALLLLDEPSLGLAPKLVTTIFETIKRINQEGMTVLLVEQNAYQALRIANRGYVLETGKIVLTDSAQSLANNPHVKAAYLGG